MLTFVINLEGAVERRVRMETLLGQMGLPYQIHPAVAGHTLSPLERQAFVHHATMTLNDIEIAVILSHVTCWQRFLKTGEPVALICEDDVVFSDGFAPMLRDLHVPESEVCTFHLETAKFLVSLALEPVQTIGLYKVHRQLSQDLGSACYVINRKTAAFLVEHHRSMRRPIDLEIFYPRNPGIPEFPTFQIVPAPAIQAAKRFGARGPWRSSVQIEPRVKFANEVGIWNNAKRYLRPAYYRLMKIPHARQGLRRMFVPFR